jgi:Putative transposase DNA-binding domain
VLVIEDLNVSGMLKNHHLAQAIGDVGFSEFKRQLTYKTAWYGSQVLLADRWEPSSKTCSACGWVDEDLTLADRTFRCQHPDVLCGLVLDRDLNAAIHLSTLAESSSDSQNACGEGERWPPPHGCGETAFTEAGTKRALAPCGIKRSVLENGTLENATHRVSFQFQYTYSNQARQMHRRGPAPRHRRPLCVLPARSPREQKQVYSIVPMQITSKY